MFIHMAQNEQSGFPPDTIADYLNTLTRSFGGGTLDHVGSAVLGPAVLAEKFAPKQPLPHEIVDDFATTTVDEMLELTKRGVHTYDSRILDKLGQHALAKVPEIRNALQQALRDPNQAAAVIDALKPLEFNSDYGQYVGGITKKLLDSLLYGGDKGEALQTAAGHTGSDASGKAQDLIISTYPWSKYDLPEMTAYVAQNHLALLDRFILTRRDPDIAWNGMQNTISTLTRAIGESSKDDMVQLMDSLSKGAGQGYGRGSEIVRIYGAALTRLDGREEYHKAFLDKFGVDGERVAAAWKVGKAWTNIRTMLALEAQRPGICRSLVNTLGICSFGRYTEKMLLEAHDALTDPPESYVLSVTAAADWNRAFEDNTLLERLRENYQIVNPDARLIPVELDSLDDIWRIARNLRSSGWNPADHVVFNAHGYPQFSHLGRDSISTANTDSAKGSWTALGVLLRNIVKKEGTILMESCSTGRGPASLAEHVANQSNRVTYAPEEVVVIDGMRVRIDPATRKPMLDVRFLTEKGSPSPTLKFTPGEPKPERINYSNS